jgi:hypothetical protein
MNVSAARPAPPVAVTRPAAKDADGDNDGTRAVAAKPSASASAAAVVANGKVDTYA